jgi:6-phosphogluconolactonase
MGPFAVHILSDHDSLMLAAARGVAAAAHEAMAAHGRFSLVLAGGSTPRGLYALLASPPFKGRLDPSKTHFFWGDERCVPPDSPDSNYRMAKEAMLDALSPPPENIHRMRGEDEPAKAAEAYEAELRLFFGAENAPPFPRFDLVLLGLGEDGHTASLFPGSAALHEKKRWVALGTDPQGVRRLTLTVSVINTATRVAVLAEGGAKAGVVGRVLRGTPLKARLPIEYVQPYGGELDFWIDREAAGGLDPWGSAA